MQIERAQLPPDECKSYSIPRRGSTAHGADVGRGRTRVIVRPNSAEATAPRLMPSRCVVASSVRLAQRRSMRL